MKKIFKYDISDFSAMMPDDMEFLHAGTDPEGKMCIWAIVNPQATLRKREFFIFPTGWAMPTRAMRHLGTVVNNQFVWHIFIALE